MTQTPVLPCGLRGVLFLPFLILLSCSAIQEEKSRDEPGLRGKAVKIVDGDTFDLLLPEKRTVRIRLHGVDCPERGQDYGKIASQTLGEICEGQQLRVVAVDSDRYGRTVGDVFTSDNTWVNLELVKRGMAWYYAEYSDDQRLLQAQQDARAARAGLWSMPNPVAPWDWRKEKRKGKGKSRKKKSPALPD